MNGDGVPTRADVGAVGVWNSLGNFDPLGDERAQRIHADGRIVLQAPGAEAAREVEEAARTHEERHREKREALMVAAREALARGVSANPGPWVRGHPASEKRREELRRAGFEERAGGIGTVWVRPANGETLKPREAPLWSPSSPT